MRRFEQRAGEVRIFAELIGRTMTFRDGSGTSMIEDVAIESDALGQWSVSQLYLRRDKAAGLFGKGPTVFARWDDVVDASATTDSQSAEHLVASYSELHPVDLAASILDLPEDRRIEVAEELSDERLADALEEMPETDQLEIIEGMDDERVADVLDNMEPDDAADLLAQMPQDRTEQILELMDPEEAEDVRFLLAFDPETAGGLMSTEPIIVSAETTVAEGLALVRRADVTPAMAAAICVTLPPFESPTGRFLGIVHFQRMLRHPPQTQLGTILDTGAEPLLDTAPLDEIARTFASYNLVSLPVVDAQSRLLGVVTVDDVLDHMLPDDWRNPYYENERTNGA
jgi:Mg/Co/Ni transporter MgtE